MFISQMRTSFIFNGNFSLTFATKCTNCWRICWCHFLCQSSYKYREITRTRIYIENRCLSRTGYATIWILNYMFDPNLHKTLYINLTYTRGRTYYGREIGNINLHNYHETSLMNLNIKLSSAVSCPLIAILERSRDSGCGDRDRLLSDMIWDAKYIFPPYYGRHM